MSDDVALRVVDDRNRSRNWSRAPSSLGVRLQLFETRAGGSAGMPLICILTIWVVSSDHGPELLFLQYLLFPMLQPGAPPSSSACDETRWMFPGTPPSELAR